MLIKPCLPAGSYNLLLLSFRLPFVLLRVLFLLGFFPVLLYSIVLGLTAL